MNIAVIGCGNWGKNLVRNYYDLNSLYALCDSDSKKLKEFKEIYPNLCCYSNIDDVLNDSKIDGIVIATPAQTHYEIAKKSLESGYPTYVEKPLTLNLKDAEELTELAKTKNVPLMVGHIMAYNPAIIKIKELIDSGVYGRIKHIKCIRVNLGKIRSHENIWWSFAPHDLSIILNFIDSKPISVQASSFSPIQEEIEDTVYADIIFESKQTAHIQVSWLEPEKLHKTTFICDKAIIVFNDTVSKDKLMVYEYSFDSKGIELKRGKEISLDYTSDQPLKKECQHFIDSIQSKTLPLTDGKNACRVIEIIESVNKALSQKIKG